MKKSFFLALMILGLAVAGYAIRVTPGSNASGDSANVAETLVYRDTVGAFAAGAVTAASLAVTGATTATGTVAMSSATLTGSLGIAVKANAFFNAAAGVVGAVYLCSDCVIPYSVCVGTGTGVADWKVSHSATVGCTSQD